MLLFGDILKFPGKYSNRNNSINDINIKIANVQNQEGTLTLGGVATGKTSQYAPKIEVYINEQDNTKLNTNHKVKVLCSCESFKYEFAGALFKKNSLLEKQYFEYNIRMHKNKDKNPEYIASGCKHIIALARYCWNNKLRPNFGLISNPLLQRTYMYLSYQVMMQNWNPKDPYQKIDINEIHRVKIQMEKLKNKIK